MKYKPPKKKKVRVCRGYFDKDLLTYFPHPTEEDKPCQKSGIKYGSLVLV